TLVDIGRKNLDLRRFGQGRRVLGHQDRERVRFLARGASGGPDPHLVFARFAGKHLRHDFLLKPRERLAVAEKIGDLDQQIAQQRGYFLLVVAQEGQVRVQVVQFAHLHSSRDAPQEGRTPVLTEVVAGTQPQQGRYVAQRGFVEIPRKLFFPLAGNLEAP